MKQNIISDVLFFTGGNRMTDRKTKLKGPTAARNCGYLLPAILGMLLVSLFCIAGKVYADDTVTVYYKTKMEGLTFGSIVSNGKISGQTGSGKGIEMMNACIRVNGKAAVSRLGIVYRIKYAGGDWCTVKGNGNDCGVRNGGKKAEAFRICLTGSDKSLYDVWYCVHNPFYGWLNWTRNGYTAGTVDMNGYADAIRIVVKRKGSGKPAAPGSEKKACIQCPQLFLSGYIEDSGWQTAQLYPGFAGSNGQAKRIEALKSYVGYLNIDGKVSLSVSYSVHMQNYGWLSAASDNAICGKPNAGKRIEALRMNISGADTAYYDIWYCVHVQNLGWMGWTRNGESAGTANGCYRAEAICALILPKGQTPKNLGSRTEAFIGSFPTKVTIEHSTMTLTTGSKFPLTAKAGYGARTLGVTWKSDRTSVAEVDSNGKITAKSAGTAKITATSSDGKANAVCTVTVRTWSPPSGTTGVTGTKTGIVGHMGLPASAPQNTEKSYLAAVKKGLMGIECDVQWTSDHRLICYHDTYLDSATNGTGRVCDLPWSYVSTVSYDKSDYRPDPAAERNPGTAICTFDTYLDICKKYNMLGVIDIKWISNGPYDLTRAVVQAVAAKGMLGQVVFQSEGPNTLRTIRNASSKARIWVLTENGIADTVIFLANSVDAEVINTNSLDAATINLVHDNRLKTCYYTANTSSRRNDLISKGCNYIMVDTIS